MIHVQEPPPPPIVGERAPDVSFRRPNGSTLRLSSLRGKIVVLEFTALSCLPCRALAPKLEQEAFKQPDVIFLTVSVDKPDAAARLLALRGKDAKTVFVQDTYRTSRSQMEVWKFGNVAVPSLFVIGANGLLASRLIQEGEDSIPHLEERIAWARRKAVSHATPPSSKTREPFRT